MVISIAPCPHKFARIATFRGADISVMGRKEFVEYHLECTKCGTMKKETF